MQTSTLLLLAGFCLKLAPSVLSFTSYDNDFIDPKVIFSKNWSPTTLEAQETIIQWADELSTEGPWSVMNKSVTPPSGTKHDYLSYAPYFWPDCSKVGNTTQLTPEQIWVTCPYVNRDGQFNPDVRVLANDIGNFGDMSDAIMYNALAWFINGNTSYVNNIVTWINVWFLNPDTAMNPNLNYAQMERGPTGQIGTHTGLLDFKPMAKIASGVLLLRAAKAPGWTSDIDTAFVGWLKQYLPWVTTNKIALQERASLNNHGSYYFNQLAAIQIMVGDLAGANQTVHDYFSGIYMGQVDANGEQPFEAARTHPYHYRCYNIAAMMTNARLAAYVGYSAWNLTTSKGATIQTAVDFAMSMPTDDPTAQPESELFPPVLAIGSTYGDAGGKYSKWLLQTAGNTYPADASFLWNQPLSDSGLVNTSATISSAGSQPTGTNKQTANGAMKSAFSWTGYAGVNALWVVALLGSLF